MTEFIKKINSLVQNAMDRCYFFLRLTRVICQIKEFDLQAKEVVIYHYGLRIITVKSSIAEVVGDPNIIVHLPPEQACWLGYYYGKFSSCSEGIDSFYSKNGSFLLRFTKGRFKIFSFDRKNILTYVDIRTNKSYRESPIAIVQNRFILSHFDPSQACYIGILAGLIVAKQGEEIIRANKKPVFTLIK